MTSAVPLPTTGPKIDYELLLDCVHCGLCTASCPTYVETGNEADSPRGRIYLMRRAIDGELALDAGVKRHLDLCLDCRACETACPSGVQYGRLIEPFRTYLAEKEPGRQLESLSGIQRWMLLRIFPSRFRTRLALAPARFAQWTGLDWLARKIGLEDVLPAKLRAMKRMLPRLDPHYGTLPLVLPAEGKTRARVALFLGCVADALYPQTNFRTARVLQMNGCDVWIPRNQGCCGALHHHAAMESEAVALAEKNLTVFGSLPTGWDKLDAIVTNAAGCGAMLKEYPHLGDNPAYRAFAEKVKDVSEFLYDLGPVKPTHPLNVKATYHDACHLRHAQQIFKQPRALLDLIPGLEVVPLAEGELCCGAAGSYNLTQPEMAGKLGDRKAANVRATGAKALFTGNVGCLMQIARHLKEAAPDVWCAHPVDALYASYTGEMPKELTAGRA
jgi:glycolate dehydrogenase iron-sulfur subunit